VNSNKQGDCYVAVTGLPDPRKDHAVAMCRFARECLIKTRVLVRKLEIRLGPDTADLAMRMGIHSGPVTAGVLRGERSRFQLFGDTMNTAARMEHTGIRDRIQLSQETTDLLIAAGKTNWISRREDLVHAKGKCDCGRLCCFVCSRVPCQQQRMSLNIVFLANKTNRQRRNANLLARDYKGKLV
jgi:class 3 adenylate cyclase